MSVPQLDIKMKIHDLLQGNPSSGQIDQTKSILGCSSTEIWLIFCAQFKDASLIFNSGQ